MTTRLPEGELPGDHSLELDPQDEQLFNELGERRRQRRMQREALAELQKQNKKKGLQT